MFLLRSIQKGGTTNFIYQLCSLAIAHLHTSVQQIFFKFQLSFQKSEIHF